MLALEAPRLNLTMSFLDPLGEDAPAAAVSGLKSCIIKGNLVEESKLKALASVSDVVTCEIEHIGADILEQLEASGVNVQPSGRVVKIIQDKLIQKEHFQSCGIPIPPFMPVRTVDELHHVAEILGLPLMLKTRRGGYDGRGNAVLRDLSESSINRALLDLGITEKKMHSSLDLYAEGWINFQSEIAVIVVRSTSGETRAYPAVTAVQTDSICRLVIAPARNVSPTVRSRCEQLASKAIDSLGKGATGRCERS
jgi:phosphoribosylaminoimidazole carboxylase